ncbi:MAG: aminoacyl-tRNA hydrolase [Candidatus Buchananbacteria bacterium CG10_big_fil_rev_8_21_14_0_10_42_9]|uniref:Peptidyl-tRNA hydrolase n=1 Tax=Candidatus Buchananbacteria bacterium CG10_big_fil_rev_8_21_14_0_10_42_9 TaxID=1974526 RepID=A0A2H0W198_9BACT|nr:MAG: aminoacyl-tRNA hydrolase [Candidatus Buchananbacteria bacterium CG10_big_fil_rev_8_21_14_0_10_42_9]
MGLKELLWGSKSSIDSVIAGLGNPGPKYQATRHNIGFVVIDNLREQLNFPDWQFNKKFKSEISQGTVADKKILLAKPQTFMNKSGEAIRAILNFYKLNANQLNLIHDDKDLNFGKIKLSATSGSAGHNGVQNIIDQLKTKNFTRVRIGVANEKLAKIPTDDFVLQKFTPEEQKQLPQIIQTALKSLN